jgi:hypothetical protein
MSSFTLLKHGLTISSRLLQLQVRCKYHKSRGTTMALQSGYEEHVSVTELPDKVAFFDFLWLSFLSIYSSKS